MTAPVWLAVISSASGLAGVTLGAALTGRAQRRQWARGKQIDACAAIVVESTRVQLALRRQWRHAERVDWVPWNEALAAISLVAAPTVVGAAGDVDELFWRHSDLIDRGDLNDEAAWVAASGLMERARLAFINATKEHVIGSSKRLERLPIRRPSEYLPGGTGDSPSTADSSS
ncbi:MAG TPA: hypothetical protein VFG33_18075 [Kribbella sp.]|uniref:hypothetical protein n=1 Tax=Kribbella sp. TaxID=1871183 RepID=UPI002D78342D|nr:hypothetical protein [Kribbella sp.]HET6295298.1 hypothetical protein [Kribbella sp.]